MNYFQALLLITLFIISGCTHSTNETKYLSISSYEDNICFSHLKSAKKSKLESGYNDSVQALGTGVNYIITGAGYTGDIIISVFGGIVVGVVVCSPIIALDAGLNGNGSIAHECVEAVGNSVAKEMNYTIGEKSYNITKGLRCPKVDYISKSLRKVASCYASEVIG